MASAGSAVASGAAKSPPKELVFNELAVKANATSILFVRASASTIAGIAAGILGLSGLYGFVFYALVSAVVGALLLALKTEGKPNNYFKDWSGVWLDEVIGNLFSFVLFWTLGGFKSSLKPGMKIDRYLPSAFSLVHVFE